MNDAPTSGRLERSLSLFDVTALGINAVIGQGIFLLPGIAVAMAGPASLVALACAGLLALAVALCFAEVGSRFRTTGGAYLYARTAFGPFVGFEVGWMLAWVGIISWAALANGLTVVLGRFFPAVASGWPQAVTAVGSMVLLALINLRGAKMGATVSTFFSVAKVVPVIVFVGVGAFYVDGSAFVPFAPQGSAHFAEATLLLLYAFVGFESAVVPAGEMENPGRAVPIASAGVMIFVAVVYAAVFTVAIGTLPEIAGHSNPVAAASGRFMGVAGGTLIAVGIVVSVFGINAGSALVVPRKIFALAERGDLPAIVARVDPETGAPRVAIGVAFAAAAALSLSGTFAELAVLGVVARFAQYIPTCLAVLVLRRREGPSAGFRLPWGPAIPVFAVAACLWLIVNSEPEKLLWGAVALALGVPFYLLGRARRQGALDDPDGSR